MLDILPHRGPKAFSIFHDTLLEDYDWLADDLEEAVTNDYDSNDAVPPVAESSIFEHKERSVS